MLARDADAESIAGKYFPRLFGGEGAMMIITDGCRWVDPSGAGQGDTAGCLHGARDPTRATALRATSPDAM